MKTITIPLEQYECLRGCLNQALEIFQSLGVPGGVIPASASPNKKETKADRLARYDRMIITNERGKKPAYLKKTK